jgi:2-phosphosulfolactate phosphatase
VQKRETEENFISQQLAELNAVIDQGVVFLKLNVFFLPSTLIQTPETAYDVYIVIDLIRATTCMSVICDRDARRIYAAGSVEQAREAKRLYPERLLCGERHSKPLPGFDYGNSPVQFSQAPLRDCELIMTTTNGTRAFHACPPESVRLAGCFYNAKAVVSRALAIARTRQLDLHLVCAGEENLFGLDDAVCAGYLALELQRQARQNGEALEADESALAAITLYETYQPPRLIEYSDAARTILANGLPADPPFCMQIDGSQSVAMVVAQEEDTGLLVLERA